MSEKLNQLDVMFNAFEVPDGNGPLDIRIVIPKRRYLLVAEDESCYYLSPIGGLVTHAVAPLIMTKERNENA